jgi:hypothetical protein
MPRPPRNLATGSPPVPHEGREQHRHHVLGRGQGDEAEDPVHLAAQAAGVDEHQALATLGELVGELYGHTAPEGLPDHGGPVYVKEVQEVAHGAGVVAE